MYVTCTQLGEGISKGQHGSAAQVRTWQQGNRKTYEKSSLLGANI